MDKRPGVVNMHLAVNITSSNKIAMLYKLSQGVLKEEHYGLSLARVINLPPMILDVAERVSAKLKESAAAKKQSSEALKVAKKRKLVLCLKETLMQARDGPMEGRVLLGWLKKLQQEFVVRMDAIERGDDEGDEEGDDDDEGMVMDEEGSVEASEYGRGE